MRRVIFSCAMSLDGFIAGPNGEYDWIVMDPDSDFAAMYARYDTFLVGRKTFDFMVRAGSEVRSKPGEQWIVFSRTLNPSDFPAITIENEAERTVALLREQSGKDIWLFGGGDLFGSLLAARMVDGIVLSVIPVLLGGGIPLLPQPAARTILRLRSQRLLEKTGTIALEYDIQRAP